MHYRGSRKGSCSLSWLLWPLAWFSILAAGLGAWLNVDLNGETKSRVINSELGSDRYGKQVDGDRNVLVLESDSRSGGNPSLVANDFEGTARSDVITVVHDPKGSSRAAGNGMRQVHDHCRFLVPVLALPSRG